MNGGRLQQMASNCLLEVASAASGNDDGCCRAEYGEIEALLTAVQNPSEIVREAGLKVRSFIIQIFCLFYARKNI